MTWVWVTRGDCKKNTCLGCRCDLQNWDFYRQAFGICIFHKVCRWFFCYLPLCEIMGMINRNNNAMVSYGWISIIVLSRKSEVDGWGLKVGRSLRLVQEWSHSECREGSGWKYGYELLIYCGGLWRQGRGVWILLGDAWGVTGGLSMPLPPTTWVPTCTCAQTLKFTSVQPICHSGLKRIFGSKRSSASYYHPLCALASYVNWGNTSNSTWPWFWWGWNAMMYTWCSD